MPEHRNRVGITTKILYRVIIVLGFAACGLMLGMLWAAKSGAADDSGLAGGAIVLGYGVIAALTAALAGLVVGLRVSESTLLWSAGVMGVVLLLFAAFVTVRMRSERLANRDPPAAYEGVPVFALTLERTDRADPVLAKSIVVDSDKRTWTSQLPDKRNCRSQASAASLRKAAGALQDFLETSGGVVSCKADPEAVLTWRLETAAGLQQGGIRLDADCLGSEPQARFLLFALEQATLSSKSPVTCR